MWDDFMRGNWPAVAYAPPAESTPRTAPQPKAQQPKTHKAARKVTLGSLFARTVPAPRGALPVIPA
jgi:hypothetical protein